MLVFVSDDGFIFIRGAGPSVEGGLQAFAPVILEEGLDAVVNIGINLDDFLVRGGG